MRFLLLISTSIISLTNVAFSQQVTPSTPFASGPLNILEVKSGECGTLSSVYDRAASLPNPLVIIDKDCPKSAAGTRIAEHVRTLDFRYGNGINIVRGNHPRIEGQWPQYSGLGTGLRQNFIITDVITPNASVTDWMSNPKEASATKYDSPGEYHSNHNHYQNLLSEVWNFNDHINGVAIWGDSGAFVPGSKSWGAFVSARSWPLYWQEYVPEGRPHFEQKDFDAQLVGIEVDVLNGGKSWVPGENQLSKTGVQIVGFGNKNTQAVEIRSEDSEAPAGSDRKGQFHYGVVFYESIAPDGTAIATLQDNARIGVDFGRTIFNQGALRLRTEKDGNGILFNDGFGGQLYADKDGALNVKMGANGIRFIDHWSNKTALEIDNAGQIKGGIVSIARSVFTWKEMLFLALVFAVVSASISAVITSLMIRRKHI
ncbi:hypothetical protein ACTOV4_00670 [Brucella sp. C7-11G]